MKRFLIFFIGAFVFCSCSQQKQEQYEQTEGGLLFLYRDKSDSELLPQDGNKLHLDVKYYNDKDSLLFNSQDITSQFIMDFFLPTAHGATINDALAMMHEGDSMSFKINAYTFFLNAGQTAILPKISKEEFLRFEIRLKKILSPEIVEKEIAQRDQEMKDEEEFLLEDFLTKNYPDIKPTKSGLYFIETAEGEGPTITKDKQVAIHYTATYINGEPIYSTYQKNNPLVFYVSDPNVWP
ncbi:MAG: hypothetical protein J6X43_04875 [Bacteroidales bacterium]|nr:hypothetical protein [Bacteroidales bacterium]